MRVEIIQSFEGLEKIEDGWQKVWQRDPSATPFQSPEWLIPWTRHLWGGGQLRVLGLWRGTELAAVAPFFLWGFGTQPEILRLSFLGSGISDYLGMICLPEFTREAAGATADWLRSSAGEWDFADLQELRSSDPLLSADPAWQAETAPCSVCPVLKLESSFDAQLSALLPAFRRSLKTAEKRLHSTGGVEIVRADDQNRNYLLARFFELHARRWSERGEAGMFSTGSLCNFHREITERACQRGLLRMYGLAAGAQIIAVQYNLAAKGRVFAYQSGFDPAWARTSPGAVLLAHSIREAVSEGAKEFDFLRHPEEFKYAWGAANRPNYRILLRSSFRVAGETAGSNP